MRLRRLLGIKAGGYNHMPIFSSHCAHSCSDLLHFIIESFLLFQVPDFVFIGFSLKVQSLALVE